MKAERVAPALAAVKTSVKVVITAESGSHSEVVTLATAPESRTAEATADVVRQLLEVGNTMTDGAQFIFARATCTEPDFVPEQGCKLSPTSKVCGHNSCRRL